MLDLTPWGALWLSVLVLGAAELVRRAVVREADVFVARVIAIAFTGKLLAVIARYLIAEVVYGTGDAFRYVRAGTSIAEQLRSGQIPGQMWRLGTPFMEFLTGLVFAVTQSNLVIGYLVFTLLSFAGTMFFFRAFTIALPEGHRRRYAVLVLLLPSMLYWPSGIGKEAWLLFALGTAALGAARLLRRLSWGYALVFLGTAGVYLIRPHIAALLATAVAVAFMLRLADPDTKRSAGAWAIGLLIIGGGAGFTVDRFDEVLPTDREDGATIVETFEATQGRTTTGGSRFDAQPVTSPQSFARALITVPFRPFPWEAHNAQARLASVESLALLVLLIASARRLWNIRYVALRRPYIALVSAYSLGFIVAFSSIGNFGILVRQRAQLLPFLLVLLCLPTAAELIKRSAPQQPPGLQAPGAGDVVTGSGSGASVAVDR